MVLALQYKQPVSANGPPLKCGTGTTKTVLADADADIEGYSKGTGKQAIPQSLAAHQYHQ
jgi:hypothetical protein